MDNDDVQVGRILSRREVIAGLSAASAALLYDPTSLAAHHVKWPKCVARPAQMEGPYFADVKLLRSDIRAEPSDGAISTGTPLALKFQVSRISGNACAPLKGALVDVWQCDAHGVYSAFRDAQGLFDTSSKKFLRGHQVTDASGIAEFTTIYPGWYPGRAVHIHFKIRTDPGKSGHEFTSQLYFDDALSDRVLAQPPYNGRSGDRRRNERDGIFSRSGGSQLMLDLIPNEDGYATIFDIGLQI